MSLRDLMLGTTSAAALYLLLAPRFNSLLYRQLIFFPTPYPVDIDEPPTLEDVQGEEVFFGGKMGQRLHGWYFRRPGSKFVMLFSHGNSGNVTIRDKTARFLLAAGCSVFVYDYQGFGKSTGKPTVEGICDDGEAAYDYLINSLDWIPEQIVLYGESLGAAVTSYLSTVRKVRAMVLQSGFASLIRIGREHFPLLHVYPQRLFPSPPLDSLSVLKKPHPPLLIIHGEKDQVIPFQHSRDLYENAIGEKTFVPLSESGHGDIWTNSSEPFQEALDRFVETLTAE